MVRGFTGRDALRAAGVRVRGVDGYGHAFVCRLQGRPRPHEDVQPGPGSYRERCNRIPPTSAYWSYWYARDGGRWRYSAQGYASRRVIRGGFEGWSFHTGPGDANRPRRNPERPGRVAGPAMSVASAGLAAPTPSDAGRPGERAARQAVRWLTADLRGGRLPGPGGRTDWGLTIDALLAQRAVGVDSASGDRIVRALAHDVDAYIGPDSYRDRRARVAGATAKVLVAAGVAGRDFTRFDGRDLRAEVRGLMQGPHGPSPGRFSDRRTGFDSSNTVTQSLGVIGLALTGRVPARAVGFLRRQQCPAGWFRMYADDGPTCADGLGGGSAPDVDGTAMAVQALLAARAGGASGLGGPLDDALGWLVSEQHENGAFAGGQLTRGPNANSTGLAGQALAAGGRTAAATRAARWLRSVQLERAAVVGTPAAGDQGAVGYDPGAFRAALSGGIDAGRRDQWRRSTAQAVLGLAGTSFVDLAGRANDDDSGRSQAAQPPPEATADRSGSAAGEAAQGATDRAPGPDIPLLGLVGMLVLVLVAALGWLVRRRRALPT